MSDIDWAMWLTLGPAAASAAGLLFVQVSKEVRAHRALAGKGKAAEERPGAPEQPSEPETDPPPAEAQLLPAPPSRRSGARGSLPSLSEQLPVSRAELRDEVADLRAEFSARLDDLRGEVRHDLGEMRSTVDRLARAVDRLKASVLRGIGEITARLAALEGWMRGWLEGSGPGSRRR